MDEKLCNMFFALSNLLRIKLLKLIYEKPINFEKMRYRFNLNNNTLSFHLKVLVKSGLIISNPKYMITKKGMAVISGIKFIQEEIKNE